MKKLLAVLFAGLFLFAAACGSDDDDESTGGDDGTTIDDGTDNTGDDGTDNTGDDGTDGTGDDGTDGTGDDGTDEPVGDGVECPFISTDDVVSAVGDDVSNEVAADGTCLFSTDDGRTFSFSLIQIALDPIEYAETSKGSCDDGTVEDVDAGDVAFACVAFGPFGAVFEGNETVSIGVTGSSDEDADVAVVAELLTHVSL